MDNTMLIEGLYSILSFEQQDDILTSRIKLYKEHEIFKGHFPGNPVMPGVCMIQIIKELTEILIGLGKLSQALRKLRKEVTKWRK